MLLKDLVCLGPLTVLGWWVTFLVVLVAIPPAALWSTYRDASGRWLPLDEVFRAYPMCWLTLVLACGVLACAQFIPGGIALRTWVCESIATQKQLMGAVGAVFIPAVGATYLPNVIPPPEGAVDIPIQWRLWVISICVLGLAFCVVLLGLAGQDQ